MKLIKITLASIALLAGSSLMAQVSKPKLGPGSTEEREKLTPEQRANKVTERMDKQLLLRPDQKSKIAELNIGIAQKNDAIRKDPNLTKDQKKERIRSNHAQRKQMLSNILDERQKQKMAEIEAKRKENKDMKKGQKDKKDKKDKKEKKGKKDKKEKPAPKPSDDDDDDDDDDDADEDL